MELKATTVNDVFMDCLFKDGEDTTNFVKAEGVMLNVGFNPERLEANKSKILDLLSELPDGFRKSAGGGWSFLQACEDKHGNHWAEHQTIDKLLVLGLASGQATLLAPREMWGLFPGSMPYFQIEL